MSEPLTKSQIALVKHFGLDASAAVCLGRWDCGATRELRQLYRAIDACCPEVEYTYIPTGEISRRPITDHPRSFKWSGRDGCRIVTFSPYIPVYDILNNEGFKQMRETIKDKWEVYVFHPIEFNVYFHAETIARGWHCMSTIVFVKR